MVRVNLMVLMPIFILALETCDKGTIIETKSNINKIPLLSRVNFKLG